MLTLVSSVILVETLQNHTPNIEQLSHVDSFLGVLNYIHMSLSIYTFLCIHSIYIHYVYIHIHTYIFICIFTMWLYMSTFALISSHRHPPITRSAAPRAARHATRGRPSCSSPPVPWTWKIHGKIYGKSMENRNLWDIYGRFMESRWLKSMGRMEEYEKSMGNLRENQLNINGRIYSIVSCWWRFSYLFMRYDIR